MQTKGYLQNWLDNFRSEDPSFLDDSLDESVTFYSPVVFSPIKGKAMTTLYLMAAGQSFNMDRFEYVKTVVQDPYSILEFETYIDDISVNGIDVITWNESGKIIEFKVMVRPLKAIEKVQEKMMKSLEEYN